jgi:hypothetical protein
MSNIIILWSENLIWFENLMMILPNGKGPAKQLSAGIQNDIIGISAQTVKKEAY